MRKRDITFQKRTDGSVVEFSPATREARVRFPVSAQTFFFFFFPFFPLLLYVQKLRNSSFSNNSTIFT